LDHELEDVATRLVVVGVAVRAGHGPLLGMGRYPFPIGGSAGPSRLFAAVSQKPNEVKPLPPSPAMTSGR
ncbi:MAG: hypothetical protein KC613_27620, partial [Myxococcales bacterium]|nr:hypothetical protein [Myxococcales bacterium]